MSFRCSFHGFFGSCFLLFFLFFLSPNVVVVLANHRFSPSLPKSGGGLCWVDGDGDLSRNSVPDCLFTNEGGFSSVSIPFDFGLSDGGQSRSRFSEIDSLTNREVDLSSFRFTNRIVRISVGVKEVHVSLLHPQNFLWTSTNLLEWTFVEYSSITNEMFFPIVGDRCFFRAAL